MADYTYQDLHEAVVSGDAVVIDIRNKKELEETGQIPNSHCIPISCLEKAFKMDQDTFLQEYGFDKPAKETSRKLVVSDFKGQRVPEAVDLLKKSGYEDVRPYKGGFEDWKQHNGPIEQYR